VPVQLPSPTEEPAATAPAQSAAVESGNFTVIALLMALLIIGSLLALSWQARNLQMEGVTEQGSRDIIEMFTILVIVGAVLILAMVSSFDPQAAITVLSGIAGYVLGRRAKK
jgi:cytochrome c biogenesis factor